MSLEELIFHRSISYPSFFSAKGENYIDFKPKSCKKLYRKNSAPKTCTHEDNSQSEWKGAKVKERATCTEQRKAKTAAKANKNRNQGAQTVHKQRHQQYKVR